MEGAGYGFAGRSGDGKCHSGKGSKDDENCLLLAEVAMAEVNKVGTVQAKELAVRAGSDSGEAEMAAEARRAK